MNLCKQIEIYAPKGFIYENEVIKYHNSELLDKPKIAQILHKDAIRFDCIIISKKARKNQRLQDQEVLGLICIVDQKFTDYASQFFTIGFRKELKNKILLLDETEESRAILRRIIHAHEIKAVEDIIAKVVVYNDANVNSLQITSTDLSEYTIDSKSIASLCALSYKELQDFEIDEYGFDIHWPKKDIHLSLESFKIVCDPKFLKKRLNEIAKEKQAFGALMKKFREKTGKLMQKDFGALNERQIRKYENGENFPSYDALQTISEKYEMSVNDYLKALAALQEKE